MVDVRALEMVAKNFDVTRPRELKQRYKIARVPIIRTKKLR